MNYLCRTLSYASIFLATLSMSPAQKNNDRKRPRTPEKSFSALKKQKIDITNLLNTEMQPETSDNFVFKSTGHTSSTSTYNNSNQTQAPATHAMMCNPKDACRLPAYTKENKHNFLHILKDTDPSHLANCITTKKAFVGASAYGDNELIPYLCRVVPTMKNLILYAAADSVSFQDTPEEVITVNLWGKKLLSPLINIITSGHLKLLYEWTAKDLHICKHIPNSAVSPSVVPILSLLVMLQIPVEKKLEIIKNYLCFFKPSPFLLDHNNQTTREVIKSMIVTNKQESYVPLLELLNRYEQSFNWFLQIYSGNDQGLKEFLKDYTIRKIDEMSWFKDFLGAACLAGHVSLVKSLLEIASKSINIKSFSFLYPVPLYLLEASLLNDNYKDLIAVLHASKASIEIEDYHPISFALTSLIITATTNARDREVIVDKVTTLLRTYNISLSKTQKKNGYSMLQECMEKNYLLYQELIKNKKLL